MRYESNGMRFDAPISQAEKDHLSDRIRKQDEDRARNARAWDRLCGMAAPIGGPVGG